MKQNKVNVQLVHSPSSLPASSLGRLEGAAPQRLCQTVVSSTTQIVCQANTDKNRIFNLAKKAETR